MSLEVHPSTIGCLLKNKNNIGNNLSTKRQKTVQYPDLENSLLDQITQHGEDVSVDDNVVAAAISKLRELLNNYELKDIYNMNEIGLEPNTTLAITSFKDRKKNKERLTVAFCVNANRTNKLKPFVIGKYPNPRCFKGIKHNRLGVIYGSSANAWMTTVLFQQWLKEFDLKDG
ncbi:18689_t:CDS:2 [Dentiscutata erythropus]|uniref:18689_t:CDS:1 n=1 Tax=Dentiscutata erythropus TaxID=1348616 RepID=A0A9N8ZHE9_9GLOM|nr:18689_t:CDS:2 [Dentiscutata erythropus]